MRNRWTMVSYSTFFADSADDIKEVSKKKEFIASNGMNYGVPLSGSTVVITSPDKTKKTYILSDNGEWNEYMQQVDKFNQLLRMELEEVTAEDLAGVSFIPSSIFSGQRKLASVVLPELIEAIESRAFFWL